jgi:tRNA A37 methylthiotransferase MiaB
MRLAITTLGCKINQYDTAVIQSRLANEHSVLFDEEVIITSSIPAVTDRADWEARQFVRGETLKSQREF